MSQSDHPEHFIFCATIVELLEEAGCCHEGAWVGKLSLKLFFLDIETREKALPVLVRAGVRVWSRALRGTKLTVFYPGTYPNDPCVTYVDAERGRELREEERLTTSDAPPSSS